MSNLEILFKEYGKPLWFRKDTLGPRNDILVFDPKEHGEEFDRNIQWQDCPVEQRPIFEDLIHKYWDVFAEEGVKKHIRGAKFHVDTGNITPVCVKPPRYGPHESRVITDLVEKLEKNGIIEDDDGPWGAPIVLAAKPNQEHLHWSQYTWRLCVSYRKLNAVTRPFTFPIIRCDDAVREIGNSRHFITMDLDSGYWQVECEESSKAKLAFFTPTGKKRFRTMPMGATNAHPVFVALVAKFKEEWDANAKKLGLQDFQSQVIVDDIMLSARESQTLIKYFECVLKVLLHYRCTAKLKKCRFLPSIAEFVGLDVHPEGNAPTRSKNEAFRKLGKPDTFTDLNMLIGCFGFYQEHIPLYEVRIKRWRDLQKLRPPTGTPKNQDKEILDKVWGPEDEKLLQELKNIILSEPILKRPDPNGRFYLKTDWSKLAMGAALLQPNTEDIKALKAMEKEIAGEHCVFDLTKKGLRLHPIAFISRRTSGPEQFYHSYVGEASTGIWAIEKFRPYLFGKEFTWLTDCSGLRKFFEGDDVPTHMIQRWRMQLLRYEFTIAHRPGRMMFECDMLSRYNRETEEWREEDDKEQGNTTMANGNLEEQKNTTMANENPEKQTSTIANEDQKLKNNTTIATEIPRTNTKILVTFNKRQKTSHNNSRYKKSTEPQDKDNMREQEEEEAVLELMGAAETIWTIGPGMTAISETLTELGMSATIGANIRQESDELSEDIDISWEEALERATESEDSPSWILITSADRSETDKENIKALIENFAWKGLRAVTWCWETQRSPTSKLIHAEWCAWLRENLVELDWGMSALPMNSKWAGSALDMDFTAYVLGQNSTVDAFRKEIARSKVSKGTRTGAGAKTLKDFINKEMEEGKLQVSDEKTEQIAPDLPQSVSIKLGDEKWWKAYSEDQSCPSLNSEEALGPKGHPIVKFIHEVTYQPIFRELSTQELCKIWGISEIQPEERKYQTATKLLRKQPPAEIWMEVMRLLEDGRLQQLDKEWKTGERFQSEKVKALVYATTRNGIGQARRIDRWTTIPMPTQHRWVEATQNDRDLRLVLEAIREDQPLERHRLTNKKFFEAWEKGLIEQEHGILYHFGEPKLTQVRQLQRKIVPKTLRQIIITGHHATPLAGHAGIYKTYWRIAARYWWPGMHSEIKDAVGNCAHCRLTNATGHENQQVLQALSTDAPFDVIALDVWSPGEVPDRLGNAKAITCLDTMTGFASVLAVQNISSDNMARNTFAHFFVPNGLPKLVLLDAGSENKGTVSAMCGALGIRYHMVSPENHNGILCERFHRYLNKVQRITAANTESFTQWAQGIAFAAYSWNAAPIDGTNLIRSFVAKGRVFPFPLQINEEENPDRIPTGQGEAAIAHLESNFPIWAKQAEMLQFLVEDRRRKHRDRANASRKQRTFNPGDLVIIRKQVTSDAQRGIPAKQTLRWKGIYRVIEAVGDKSYNVQRIPTIQGMQTAGRIQKYAAAVMEKIPSSLVIHKNLDTTDTRLASLEGPLVQNPLEQNLGLEFFGKYIRAPEEANFAFDKIEDLWDIEVDDSEDEEDPEEQLPDSEQSRAEEKENLYRQTNQSRDKLFIIKLRTEDRMKKDWYVVQVNWEETSEEEAILYGKYKLQWLIPNEIDARRRRRVDCRYWKEIHMKKENGELGAMRMVSPAKATPEYVRDQGWTFYEWEMNLLDCKIVGPFNFSNISKEAYRVHKDEWRELREKADPKEVDLTTLDRVIPL